MAKREDLRTERVTFWWRWWDEAEHKSSPEKRLAFYDALIRHIFTGAVPKDPCDMESPTGVDYAAYDATHYFDVIDSMIEGGKRGAPNGNQNARKNNSKTNKNNSENNSETKVETKNENKKTTPYKNEERRKKNEEEEDVVVTRAGRVPPTIDEALAFAKDAAHHPGGKAYPEEWVREWFVYMEASSPPWTKDGRGIGSWKQKMICDFAIHESRERRGEASPGRGSATNQPGSVRLRRGDDDYENPFK